MMISLFGGFLIGAAALWMMITVGRIAGISGIAGRAVRSLGRGGDKALWPWLFLLGLGIGGWLAYAMVGPLPTTSLDTLQVGLLVLGGLLVGFGTRLGSGCTSGHGVCGISRFSKRSLVATGVFLCVGLIVATAIHGFLL